MQSQPTVANDQYSQKAQPHLMGCCGCNEPCPRNDWLYQHWVAPEDKNVLNIENLESRLSGTTTKHQRIVAYQMLGMAYIRFGLLAGSSLGFQFFEEGLDKLKECDDLVTGSKYLYIKNCFLTGLAYRCLKRPKDAADCYNKVLMVAGAEEEIGVLGMMSIWTNLAKVSSKEKETCFKEVVGLARRCTDVRVRKKYLIEAYSQLMVLYSHCDRMDLVKEYAIKVLTVNASSDSQ